MDEYIGFNINNDIHPHEYRDSYEHDGFGDGVSGELEGNGCGDGLEGGFNELNISPRDCEIYR